MIRFAFFPTGRTMWFEAAAKLKDSGIAEPVLWIGDKRLEVKARQRFPDAYVFPLDQLYFGDLSEAPVYRGEMAEFLLSENFARAKERGGKMLDRLEYLGDLKGLSRELYITRMALWAMSVVADKRPEAAVMAENPHAPATYVLYELFKWLGLPIFSFTSWSFLPGFALRSDLWGPMHKAPALARGNFDDEAERLITGFAEALLADNDAASVPDYMQLQFEREKKWSLVARALAALPRRKKVTGLRGVLAQDGVSRAAVFNPVLRRVEKTRAIERALRRHITPEVDEPYVFVPLHYEPERTTNPDGDAFHDQLLMLAELRSLLPAEIRIRVKEHPSQLLTVMNGFLGRSAAFYEAAQGIDGLSFAPTEQSSRALIRGSLGVATITGTAALEAAVLGKQAIVFGTPWFVGCPNVHHWHRGMTAPFDNSAAPSAAIVDWLTSRWREVGLFGTVNPSNEDIRKAFYSGDARKQELDGVVTAIAAALTGAFTEAGASPE